MYKIYFISGLGADERVFQNIDLNAGSIEFIPWITPYENETLQAYVRRIGEKINQKEKYILIGVSIGGMIAIELSKILQPEKTIIISSIATKHDLPWYYRLAGKLALDHVLPVRLFKTVNCCTYYFFGVHDTKEKILLQHIIQDTDEKFIQWAIYQILRWHHTETLPGLIHIHGTRDKLLPLQTNRPVIRIEGGGHWMIVNKAAAINDVLNGLLR